MKKVLALISTIAILSTFAVTVNAKITNPEIKTSVVQIWNQESDGQWYTGSGVIISSDAVILTAAHVIMDYTTNEPSTWLDICITVSEYEEPSCDYSGYVMAYDESLDLALIAPSFALDADGNEIGEALTIEDMQAVGLPYVDISDYEPALGDNMTILGYPSATGSVTLTLTYGVVSNFIQSGIEGFNGYYVTDATINPGNSGGPVYNEDEKLIGVVSQVSTEGIGGNYGYIVAGDMIYLWFWDLVDQGVLNEPFVSATFSNDYADTDTSDIDFNEVQDSLEADLDSINFGDNGSDHNSIEIFTDVNTSSDNAAAIDYLKTSGIISGYSDGSFKPKNSLNRAELLKILVEGTGYSPDETVYKNCFPDVKADWYAKYVCYAKEQGWISGYPDGTFKPSNNVNKAEALKMLLEVFVVDLQTPEENPFKDVFKNEWYATYIYTAKSMGLLEETGQNYSPGTNITRGQISENIYRLLVNY